MADGVSPLLILKKKIKYEINLDGGGREWPPIISYSCLPLEYSLEFAIVQMILANYRFHFQRSAV